ncbi:ABC transporter substrate-binding protein [Polaribacter reichenbachii]|uniref:ABC transporter substrate-binding protein n=1 Tax=Polaribacter reichenbachii TaxID=996801 RepID=A0A1B8U1E9_9FLAO|nr:ABC transporter substrate-binding protein [Polaribacter reichenbachii]APZ47207.1 ABC transporter substrate-binding protein [Polaribacter reichenbachii]AUC17848.1 ABC transporter substrate-binding protein [Polaribacter reichenbachii]OBY65662.1 ABC transporter substrate-binding protein [Polaribacter reichenbachii]
MILKREIIKKERFIKAFFFLILLVIISCKKEATKVVIKSKSDIKYAKGFDIINDHGTKKLIIKSAYKGSNEVAEYTIKTKGDKNSKVENTIFTPIQQIVVTSTTHIPMVELLNEETAIVGFPYSKYVSSEKTRNLIDAGKIQEIGKESSLNTEILLDLQPELVVGYSVSSADKSLTTIKKAGINVIYNGDWLEETPLGRAEWIKFFGVLFDKEQQADSIFKVIEVNYNEAKQIALKSTKKPTILSGAIMSKDIWNLPAGDSFVAQYLKDANCNYLWQTSKGTGSLSLSFESVFDKGADAEFWIAPGYFTSKEQLLSSNELYSKFTAFKMGNIFTPSTKKGKTGGVIYYELAPTRPDLVLKDIIKITNPELLLNYKLTFFEKMF